MVGLRRTYDVSIGRAVAWARQTDLAWRVSVPTTFTGDNRDCHIAHDHRVGATFIDRGPVIDAVWHEHLRLTDMRIAFGIGAAWRRATWGYVSTPAPGLGVAGREGCWKTGLIVLDPRRWLPDACPVAWGLYE